MPSVIDITDHVVNYLNANFVNKQVSTGDTEIDRSTNDLGVGDRTNASGSASIASPSDHNGKIEKAPMFDGFGYRAELNVSYRYESQTSAKKYSIPSGILIDNPWKNLHPAGEVEFHIHAGEDNNWTVVISRMTFEAGHPDRPNYFIRDFVAVKFLDIMKELLREAINNSPNPIED
ncbi:hypothetical protein ABXH30_11895 [Bacillus velezensis]|uniref:hypothetical protein n=1 Tax=Bacillus velezensis TaxID=492670 RepID=UPI00384D001C